MKMDFNLQLQQEQKLVMTQELQLAVKMLQLTSQELTEYIDEQVMENPMLEIEEKNEEKAENFIDAESQIYQYFDKYENYNRDDIDYSDIDDSEYVSPLNFISREATLWQYLKEQLGLSPVNKEMKQTGEYIIDNIDENGYLTVDSSDISRKCRISSENAEKMVNFIQSFEPAGICARNIQECLMIQIKRKGIFDKTLEKIVMEMLEDIGESRIKKIAKECSITIEQTEKYIEIIKKLDPKPGLNFYSGDVKYVIPEVFIEKTEGQYIVTVNDDSTPHLRINKAYKGLLDNRNTPEYKYIKDKFQSALWIIKSIQQRLNTIKRVMEAILEYQIDFFEYDTDLLPMTLRQIAEMTGLHESTVSRAIKGKYVQTPKGVFEIKNFFARGIQTKNGEDIATNKIKNRIKELIEGENPQKPYSDQQLSEMLCSEKMSISRRTVAKYREELNIQSSSKRKKI